MHVELLREAAGRKARREAWREARRLARLRERQDQWSRPGLREVWRRLHGRLQRCDVYRLLHGRLQWRWTCTLRHRKRGCFQLLLPLLLQHECVALGIEDCPVCVKQSLGCEVVRLAPLLNCTGPVLTLLLLSC